MEKRVYAVDYETYYDAEYSLKKIPTWAYVWDARFDAYLVSVAGPDNFLWVGHPSKFDWAMLDGQIILHHNAGFDALVTKRLQQENKIPFFNAEIFDTIDLCRYLKLPAALKDAMRFIYKRDDLQKAGKRARDRMRGASSSELAADPKILEYAAADAVYCLKLWEDYSDLWPETEREVSRLTREAGWRGVKVNVPYVNDCVGRLQVRLFEASKEIPWDWSENKTPLSQNKIVAHAKDVVVERRPLSAEESAAIAGTDNDEEIQVRLNRLWESKKGREHRVEVRDGILVKYMWYPASFDKDDKECEAWEDEYSGSYPWIKAIRDWRRQNALLQKFLHLVDFTAADGIFRYQKKYGGAHTGRWSGDGRFNMENLPREEMFHGEFYPEGSKDAEGRDVSGEGIPGTGFHLRQCFVGDFLILDYRQIEARIELHLVKDEDQLALIRQGMSTYEAYARAKLGWTGGDLKETGKRDKAADRLYRLAKACVLGGGYGCGGDKFASTAWTMARLKLTPAEGAERIKEFRAANPKFVAFWRLMDRVLRQAVSVRKECMKLTLPSGRTMYYWNPRERTIVKIVKTPEGDKTVEDTGYFTQLARNNPSSYRKTYGANLVENLCQGIARDILADAWRALDRAGYVVAVTVHDEFVIHRQPGQTLDEAERIILEAGKNSWAAEIPLALDKHEETVFTK